MGIEQRSSEPAVVDDIPKLSFAEINNDLLRAIAGNVAVIVDSCPIERDGLHAALIRIGGLLGEPFTDLKESTDIVQDIRPEVNAPMQSSNTYLEELRLHTENPHVADEPDFVLIGCLNNAEQAVTLVADPNVAYGKLGNDERDLLLGPLFDVTEAAKFAAEAGRKQRLVIAQNVPVAIARSGGYDFRVDFEEMSHGGMTPESPHMRALALFEEECCSIAKEIILQTGQVLVLPNHRVVHGRRAFNANPDLADRRHTQRLFVRS